MRLPFRKFDQNATLTAHWTQPCQSCPVELTPGGVVRWQPLMEDLRRLADTRRALQTVRWQERELPFRDVILRGPHDPELLRARALEDLLNAEFADAPAEFQTLSIDAGGAPNSIRAFFGHGIFAPGDGDRQVADLQFSWSDPAKSAVPFTPMLDAQRPAAWYAGQMGVAIGFESDVTPACLNGAPADLRSEVPGRRPYLYVGRRDRLTPPVFEIYCDDRTVNASAVCENPAWWLRNGEWQSVRIRIADLDTTLWFRIMGRTGSTLFRGGGDVAKRAGKPQIIVRGLLLPNVPTFGALVPGQGTDRLTRWTVEFDSRNALRINDISELAHSIVAQWGARFGIYRHRAGKWLPRGWGLGGQKFQLSPGWDITHRRFPRAAGSVVPDPWRKIYRHDWSLLQFFDRRPLGYFEVSPDAEEIVTSPQPSAELIDPDDGSAERVVCLDWLNRAVVLSAGDEALGLADYWGRHWRTKLFVSTDYLRVEAEHLTRTGPPIKYNIERGKIGPCGPLYIEYN